MLSAIGSRLLRRIEMYYRDEVSYKDPLTEQVNKIESVLAQLAKDYYGDEEPTAKVTDIPKIAELQRENTDLKTTIKALKFEKEQIQAEAKRWKEAAQRHIAVIDNIVTISLEIEDATQDYR
jgi:hypothetical protein